MERPIIKISYRWSEGEMLLLNRIHMRNSAQGRKLTRGFKSTGIIFLVMGTIAFCSIGATPEKLRALCFGFGLVLLGVALLWGMPYLNRTAVLKMYAKKPDKDLVMTYEVSDDGISCKSDVASSEMLWRVIVRGLRAKEGFLLYISDIQTHWLPIHGFQDATDVSRFADLTKAKVQDYKEAS